MRLFWTVLAALTALVTRPPVCANFLRAWPRLQELTGHVNLASLVNRKNLLATGGFARVYLTPFRNKYVAFKLVSLATPRKLVEFEREVGFLRAAKGSRGVAALRGCIMGSVNGQRFGGLFIEYLPVTLEQLAPQIPFVSLSYRFKLYARLAEDLAELHARNILHNDYKPRNVIVGGSEVLLAKMIDLGGSCRRNEVCYGGTELYAAPEKIGRNMRVVGSEAVDVWAFLVSVIELEAGGMDYPHLSEACFKVMMTLACFDDFKAFMADLLDNTPDALFALLLDSLAFDPADRPTMAQLHQEFLEMDAALSEVVNA